MTAERVEVDSFEPDYENECCNCGTTPIVNVMKDKEVIFSTDMCGPCTWGEARTIDPSTWNE